MAARKTKRQSGECCFYTSHTICIELVFFLTENQKPDDPEKRQAFLLGILLYSYAVSLFHLVLFSPDAMVSKREMSQKSGYSCQFSESQTEIRINHHLQYSCIRGNIHSISRAIMIANSFQPGSATNARMRFVGLHDFSVPVRAKTLFPPAIPESPARGIRVALSECIGTKAKISDKRIRFPLTLPFHYCIFIEIKPRHQDSEIRIRAWQRHKNYLSLQTFFSGLTLN